MVLANISSNVALVLFEGGKIVGLHVTAVGTRTQNSNLVCTVQ